ncbi:SDR family oxidoreductase [Pseudoduganella sp. UC29_106]|uniref:SDR family oxidoreductase n=1 Tax=Pseudoduganella sp. UC29_106 TaxID=3374553 RepID=UPI0037575AFA
MQSHFDSNGRTYSGQVVLVTGGTRGIGRAIAMAFLERGATVLVCGRKPPEEPVAAGGRRAAFIRADVRDAEQVQALYAAIQQQHGRLDILVNNAGGSPHVMAADASPRLTASIIALNLTAPLLLAQGAYALMAGQGGVILFIGSVSALRPSPGTAAYGAAKAGIVNLVRSLAVEWAPRVRVAAVSPGLVLTDEALSHYGDESRLDAVGATIPLGRLAQPEEIASACLYLASPAAAYASGCNLVLDGGGERPAFLAAANPAA